MTDAVYVGTDPGLTDARKSIKHRHRRAFGSSITWGRFRQMQERDPLPFGGWKSSLYGDLYAQGADAVAFYTRKKVISERWFGAEAPKDGWV